MSVAVIFSIIMVTGSLLKIRQLHMYQINVGI